jgi:diacylglycerol kinase family enzyme
METLLIINPHSRGGRSAAKAQELMEYLRAKNYAFNYVETGHFDDAYKYSSEASRNGVKNIIAVGGDGTINKVLNGFYDSNGSRISSSRFGVVHTGTSPDFCKSYEIPVEVSKAADAIIRQNTINIPVGMIRLSDEIPKTDGSNSQVTGKTKYFTCCANVGLGAALARSANSGVRLYLGDFLGTLFSLLKILMHFKSTDYKVIIDDNEATLKKLINVSVGITRYIASGINICNTASMPSDHFYILKIPETKFSSIPGLIKLLYSGKEFTNSHLASIEYASRIEFLGNPFHPEIEFDGDPAGFLPCKIEFAKDMLPLFSNRRDIGK